MEISKLIKFYRKQKNFTQEELAKIIDVSQDSISLWEKGKVKPNYEAIRKMCIIFDISGDEILEIETPEQRKTININNSFNNNKGNQKININ